jgi:hypothetical protein
MGKRGTKNKPTALKKLTGNPGRRPLPKNEPMPPPVDPSHSSEFKGESLEWFNMLKDLGILTEADVPAFRFMRLHYLFALKAANRLQAGSMTRTDLGNWRNDSAAFLRYASQFGMTPSARASLSVIAPEKKEKSLAEQLFEDVIK